MSEKEKKDSKPQFNFQFDPSPESQPKFVFGEEQFSFGQSSKNNGQGEETADVPLTANQKVLHLLSFHSCISLSIRRIKV
jgi:hypothetical protein